MATMLPTFQPSDYQLAIFEFVQSGKGNGVVLGVPGCGKTKTLLEVAKQLPRSLRARIVAFNTHIAADMTTKLQLAGCRHIKASTIHSLGKQALMKNWGVSNDVIEVDKFKYNRLCTQALNARNAQYDPILIDALKTLVNFSRITLAKPTVNMTDDQLWLIATQQELEIKRDSKQWQMLLAMVPAILQEGREIAVSVHPRIDFSDMLWLPLLEDMTMPLYQLLLVDEAQDLNPAQLELVLRCVDPDKGRSLFVGDANQSIYGFSGADTKSIEKIIERTNATQLPLSICYRCATTIIEQAAAIYPGIEAAPHAIPGYVGNVQQSILYKHAKPGDLILCRMIAPLVEECIHFFREGVRAKMRGRDLGKSFLDILEHLKEHPDFTFETLLEVLQHYTEIKYAEFDKKPDAETLRENFGDKVDTIKAFLEGFNLRPNAEKTLAAFEDYIKGFFSDESEGAVIFSTVHRAKGLEAKNVYILKRELMPLSSAKTDEQRTQEKNLKYVAYTRAQQNMYFIIAEDEDATSGQTTFWDDDEDDDGHPF